MVEIETHNDFANRLTKLGRKHKLMTDGYTTELRKDGLIIVKPKRKTRHRGMSGSKLLLIGVFGFFCFKTLIYVDQGPRVYQERLAKMESGTVVEQLGATLFQVDPVTQGLADFFGPLFR